MSQTPPQQFCVRWNSYHTNLQNVFPKLLTTENFVDVTLACENQQIKCHKVVLSACSTYFERLLIQNPCKHPIIFMKDMRFSEMQSLVDFMYKGEVNVSQDDLPSLLKSAEALQIRGLCGSDTGGLGTTAESSTGSGQSTDTVNNQDSINKLNGSSSNGLSSLCNPQKRRRDVSSPESQTETTKSTKKIPKSSQNGESSETVKEETVEEDGLFYGEMENDDLECNQNDDDMLQGLPNPPVNKDDHIKRKLISTKRARKNIDTVPDAKDESDDMKIDEKLYDDEEYVKMWLQHNEELEVSMSPGKDGEKTEHKNNSKAKNHTENNEIDDKKWLQHYTNTNLDTQKSQTSSHAKHENFKIPGKKKGRPPNGDNGNFIDYLEPSDLDQFVAGKEVSSSGISRRAIEQAMMGKYNPNRRYSNQAMWAALMDVKQGGSIYRAAQTHKVPRKSLRNWMKRWHIKSSFPMPQQLKQFVENNKKQKDDVKKDTPNDTGSKKKKDSRDAKMDMMDAVDNFTHFLEPCHEFYSSGNAMSSEDDDLSMNNTNQSEDADNPSQIVDMSGNVLFDENGIPNEGDSDNENEPKNPNSFTKVEELGNGKELSTKI